MNVVSRKMANRKEKKVAEKVGESSEREVEAVTMDRFEKFIADLRNSLEAKLAQNQNNLEINLAQNQQELKNSLENSLEVKLTKSQSIIESRLQEGAEKCESNINLLKTELKQAESRLERQITGCRDSLEAKLAEEIKCSSEQLENKLTNNMQENVNRLGVKINEVRQDLEVTRNELRAEAETNVGSLRKEIEELQTRMSSLLTEIDSKNKEWKDSVEIQLKTGSQNVVEEIRSELGSELEEFKTKQAQVISACEQSMKSIEKGVALGLTANREEMQDVRVDCRTRLEKGLDEIRDKINTLSMHMKNHATGTEEKISQFQKEIENEKVNYNSLASAINHLQAERVRCANMHDYSLRNAQLNSDDNVVECISNPDFNSFDKIDENCNEDRLNSVMFMRRRGQKSALKKGKIKL